MVRAPLTRLLFFEIGSKVIGQKKMCTKCRWINCHWMKRPPTIPDEIYLEYNQQLLKNTWPFLIALEDFFQLLLLCHELVFRMVLLK